MRPGFTHATRNRRTISDEHRARLRTFVAARVSRERAAKELGVSLDTMETALIQGSPFRASTAERVEKAIDAAGATP